MNTEEKWDKVMMSFKVPVEEYHEAMEDIESMMQSYGADFKVESNISCTPP